MLFGASSRGRTAFTEPYSILRSNRNFKPFVYAAHGLVAFRLGSFQRGRDFYTKAIESCREIQNASLAANASGYWLEQELFAGTVDAEEATVVVAKLDEIYGRKEHAANLPAWTARKQLIAQMMQENSQRKSALERLSQVGGRAGEVAPASIPVLAD